MPLSSSPNDRRFDLLKKIARNSFEWAEAEGAAGAQNVSSNDTEYDLLKKTCTNVALINS